jgi:hypothetical protein
MFRLILLFSLASATLLNSQFDPRVPPDDSRHGTPEPVRLPSGKLQQDEILKEDHDHSLQDAKQLVELSQSLRKDLEQTGSANVLSLASIHKTEEIEKIAKRIRSRMRRY